MKKAFMILLVIVVAAAGLWFVTHKDRMPTAKTPSTAGQFNKQQYSLSDPASLWVIVNKHRLLQPKDYAPNDLVVPDIPLRLAASSEEMHLRKPAADALQELAAQAQKDGLKLMVASGYRSYQFQISLYNGYVQQQGKATADSQSARPGYSEHQTGLAVDLEPTSRNCEVDPCFGDTPEGKWLAANAWKYGFIVRYQTGKQGTTGYIAEPWHVRYVGKTLAAEVNKQGNPPLEDFFGLGAAPDYN